MGLEHDKLGVEAFRGYVAQTLHKNGWAPGGVGMRSELFMNMRESSGGMLRKASPNDTNYVYGFCRKKVTRIMRVTAMH